MPALSVIICTHNPRPDYLRRVLEALKLQTLPKDSWELVIVDNASAQRLSDDWNLSWHPHGRHVREDELGLTPARLRGIAEVRGEVLVFVDDDNVLHPDFLAKAVEIAGEFPFIGAWGGNVEGDFEHQLPDWLEPHLAALAIRKVDRDYWSNYYSDNVSMPCGAGLCVRKFVADAHVRALLSRPASKQLDRKGSSLISSGDIDLALTAYDSGMGTGMFRRLRTTHIIPKERMTVDYLCRLLEAIEYSVHLLRKQRNPNYNLPLEPALQRWVKSYREWKLPEPIKSFAKAQSRGFCKAMVEIKAG